MIQDLTEDDICKVQEDLKALFDVESMDQKTTEFLIQTVVKSLGLVRQEKKEECFDFSRMVGKTITSVDSYKVPGTDDKPCVGLNFSDGTGCYLMSFYGMYTGQSNDEYPCFLGIFQGVPCEDFKLFGEVDEH